MTPDKTLFSRPATNVASCMAVAGRMPGVFPSNVAVLAIAEFRKDFPRLAARLDAMRQDACGGAGSDAGAGAAEGVLEFSVHPDGNNGDNLTNLTDKAVL